MNRWTRLLGDQVTIWVACTVVAACGSGVVRSSTARELVAPHLRRGSSPWGRAHERRAALPDVTVAEAELGARRVTVEANVVGLRAAVVAAVVRLRNYGADLLPRLEQTIDLLRRSFELGEIELLDVLVARERFLRIQSDMLDAHLEYFVALAELECTVGVEICPDDPNREERTQ